MSSQSIPLPIPRMEKGRVARRWIAFPLTGLLAIVAIFWYASDNDEVSMETTSPQIADIETTISSTGTVLPAYDFPARAAFSGMVTNIYVHVGQTVRPGQMLITMKDQFAAPRVRNASVELHAAEVALQNVRNNGSQEDHIGFDADLARSQMERDSAAGWLSTIKQLNTRGSASDDEVYGATQRLQSAQAALDTIQRRMQNRYSADDVATWKEKVSAGKANLSAQRTSWADANISSPVGGTVYALPVSRYDFVSAGSDLLHVADLTHVQIRSDFYIPDLGDLHTGAPVSIRWEGRPNQTWAGHIISKPLAVSLNGLMSTGRCLIALDSPIGDLPVNSTVTVVITAQKHNGVLTIPREALYTEPSGHFVYRVSGRRLKKTAVAIGLINSMRAEVTSGLTAKDIIALHADDNQPLSEDRRLKAPK